MDVDGTDSRPARFVPDAYESQRVSDGPETRLASEQSWPESAEAINSRPPREEYIYISHISPHTGRSVSPLNEDQDNDDAVWPAVRNPAMALTDDDLASSVQGECLENTALAVKEEADLAAPAKYGHLIQSATTEEDYDVLYISERTVDPSTKRRYSQDPLEPGLEPSAPIPPPRKRQKVATGKILLQILYLVLCLHKSIGGSEEPAEPELDPDEARQQPTVRVEPSDTDDDEANPRTVSSDLSDL